MKTSTYKNLFFFKNKKKIGKVIENMKYLNDTIESLISKINIYSHKIKLLRSRRILCFQSHRAKLDMYKKNIKLKLINFKLLNDF